MGVTAVAGSNNSNRFAVIDFSVPSSPGTVLVTPPFSGGCMVDCTGTTAAVGNYNGGQIVIYDISNPGAPAQKGSVSTALSGVGAISADGTHVLAGEVNGSRVVLIDISNPAAPAVISTVSTAISSIGAIALKGTLAVASGPNNPYFVMLNYANPASPSQVQFTPGTSGVYFNGAVTCDLDAAYAALADYSGGKIDGVNVAGGTPALLGQFGSDQQGVSSVSVSGTEVAAASTNDTKVTLASFQTPSSPSGADTPSGLGGGAVVKLVPGYLAAGAVNGTDVTLFSVAGNSASVLGLTSTAPASIGTLGLTTTARIAVSPASLAFGTVRVGTPSPAQAVTLTNSGNAPLNVTALSASIPQYAVSPAGSLPAIAPGHSATVQVTFTPTAVQSYSATLTMTTNDPLRPAVSVQLTGTGGEPAAAWSPAQLAFGTVQVGSASSLTLIISNSGTVPLHVTGVTASPPAFTASPATLTVAPGGSQNIQVTFSPGGAASYSASLTIQTDDPSHASVSIQMTGTGVSPPQTGLEVFAKGPDGNLGRIWQTTGGWSAWADLGPAITSNPVVGKNADGRLEVFARGPDGRLGHTAQATPSGAWSVWTDLGPAITGDPAVTLNASGLLAVFARDANGNLGHMTQTPAGGWTPWTTLGPVIYSNPAVASNSDGRLEVVAQGPALAGPPAIGHIWELAPGGNWSSWTDFGTIPGEWYITGNPALGQNADGRLEVFAKDSNGNLGHMWQQVPGGNWISWQPLGPALVSDPIVARNADGRLELFADGPAQAGPPAIGHMWQLAPNSGWSSWTDFGTIPGEWTITGNPAVGQNADGRLEVFAKGPDGNLGHMWQQSPGGDWISWQPLGPAITGNPAVGQN